MSDRLEIADVVTRYTRAIDTGDWDGLDRVFTTDAEIDYTESGGIAGTYPEVKAWLAEVLPAFFPRRMHTIGQVAVDFESAADRRRASVVAYFDNPMPVDDGADGQRLVELGGLYHHQMERTDAGWRSRRLREEVVWRRGM